MRAAFADHCRCLVVASIAAAMLWPAAVPAAPGLVVDTAVGAVSGELPGATRRLTPGVAIGEREVLRTAGPESRLSLLFADQGLLELGADAQLAIEKLPASGGDQRSLASLRRGQLRALWMPPPEPLTDRPFHLFIGDQRATLAAGEFFFERGDGVWRICIASGRLVVAAMAGDGSDILDAGACYDLQEAGAARRQPRSADHWQVLRRAFTTAPVGTTAEAAAAASVAPSASAWISAAPTGQPAGWTLLLGSYSAAGNAEQVAEQLREAGLEPLIRVKEIDGRVWYSVQIRGFSSRSQADNAAADLHQRLGIEAIKVVLLP